MYPIIYSFANGVKYNGLKSNEGMKGDDCIEELAVVVGVVVVWSFSSYLCFIFGVMFVELATTTEARSLGVLLRNTWSLNKEEVSWSFLLEYDVGVFSCEDIEVVRIPNGLSRGVWYSETNLRLLFFVWFDPFS